MGFIGEEFDKSEMSSFIREMMERNLAIQAEIKKEQAEAEAKKAIPSDREKALQITMRNAKKKSVEACKTSDSFHFFVPDAKQTFEMFATLKAEVDGVQFRWPEWYDEIVRWMSADDGKWLFLNGNSGIGKTYLTSGILMNIAEFLGWGDRCLEVNRFNVKDTWKLAVSRQYDVIVLDDMGQEDKVFDDYVPVNAYDKIINNAYRNGQCLIMSSNYSANELGQNFYGAATLNRMKARSKFIQVKDGRCLRYERVDSVKYDYTDGKQK